MTPWIIRGVIGAALWMCIPVARARAQAEPVESVSANEAPEELDTLSASDIARAMQRYRHEPSVAEVIAAAIQTQQAHPRRVAALASKARIAGWLPTLRVSARRGQTIDLLAAQTTTTDRNSASSGDDLVLEAQLTFDLARLVWSNQELRVEREFRAERHAQHELVRWINSLYFERRRLQIERDVEATLSVETALRILEIEGLLDGLTGGAFSQRIRAVPAVQ